MSPDLVNIGALRSESGVEGFRVSSGPWPPAVESIMTTSQRVLSDPGIGCGATSGITEWPTPVRFGRPSGRAGCQARMSPGWIAPTFDTACQPAWGVELRLLKNSSKWRGVGTYPGAMWRA